MNGRVCRGASHTLTLSGLVSLDFLVFRTMTSEEQHVACACCFWLLNFIFL